MSAGAVRLRAEGLAIGYEAKRGNAAAVAAGLSLELRAGEFVCLLGPNGVGKTTLIRSLAGMQLPLAGSIEIGNTSLQRLSPKERARAVSVVLTDSLPMGLFTAYALVALGRHPHTGWAGKLGRRDRERIEWALRAVGAWELAERQVSELSDGERQKVMIARALAQEASLMLLDEPTAFLDLPRRVDLMRLLRDLARQEGMAILLSTHDLDLALRSADRLWLLDGEGALRSGMPETMALEGSIASVFASEEVDWDERQGSFRMHREFCATVALRGGGAAAEWTRRALMRLGFEVVEESAFVVAVERSAEGPSWRVERDGESRRFDRLETLVEWAKVSR